ncbi:MAG: AEC family transporter [Candidatus Pelethousia sp.]|nr:AEC family transporter [Candidatus Pelethousia sp.]
MQSFFHSVSAVLVILLLTATGYFLGRIGYIRPEHKAMLPKLVVNVALPCMCLSNLTRNFTHASLAEMGYLLLIPLLVQVGGMLISWAAARILRLPHNRQGIFMAMGAFSNSTFIGLPMCVELFGEGAVPYVMCYYLINTILFQTFGIAFIERSGQPEGYKVSPLKRLAGLLKKPPLLSILCALVLIWFEIPLPDILQSYTKYIGDMVSPLALIYTGYIIYEYGLKNLRMERGLLSVLGLRFLVGPALCIPLCALLGAQGLARGVFIVESGLPTMTQTVVLSAMLGADENYAALGAAVSTICCFAVVPVIMMLV